MTILGLIPRSHGVEQKVGEETVPLNEDSSRKREPDGSNDRGGREKFLHGSQKSREWF